MTTFSTVLGIMLAVFLGILELIILWLIWKGDINLNLLISEKNQSGASLSRFQFLIFTFVIAMSFFLVVVNDPTRLPDIPTGVFTLLGISGGSYVVSKGIQTSLDKDRGPSGGGGAAGTAASAKGSGGSAGGGQNH